MYQMIFLNAFAFLVKTAFMWESSVPTEKSSARSVCPVSASHTVMVWKVKTSITQKFKIIRII